MGNFFEKIFTPLVHIQNDQCVMGIILRYVCWGTHRPPPPWGGGAVADRPTRRPPRFGSTKGGWVPFPPLQPPKLSHTPRGHTLAGGGPRAVRLQGDHRVVLGSDNVMVGTHYQALPSVSAACTRTSHPNKWTLGFLIHGTLVAK